MEKFYFYILFFFLNFYAFLEAKPPNLTPLDTYSKIEEILSAHATYHTLNEELIKRSLNNFLQEMDPSYTYFIDSEIVKWNHPTQPYLKQILKAYQKKDFSPFEELHQVMVKAITRRRALEKDLLQVPINKAVGSEEFKNSEWAKNSDELKKKILQLQDLQIKSIQKVLDKDVVDQEAKKNLLQRLQKKRLYREEELMPKDPVEKKQLILSYILKSVSSALDSHTNYFTPKEASQFMIQVQQRLFGVGAQLRDDFDGFTIVHIVENSPISQSSEVTIDDKIIAIDHEPVVGMDLTEVVELIRGPENTEVNLTLLRKTENKTYTITAIRKEIVLKESRLQTTYEPFGDGVIGVLKLFSFYQDPKYSSSQDLSEAIELLKKEHHLKGIILDLRNNTGGLLPQAVSVCGLFMKKGVVVSIKDNKGLIQRLRNTSNQPAWDGPLMILVDKTSASAAEIVAQTLQEYGRALIVGDAQTYGKGTFQTFTLDSLHQGKINPKGEYKVTRGKYYTPTGRTPQLTGVFSDITVPGLFSNMEIGESFSKFPLEPDQISPSFDDDLSDIPLDYRQQALYFYKYDLQPIVETYKPYLEILKKNSKNRILLNSNYQAFLEKIEKKDFYNATLSGQSDPQLREGIDIMKDLLLLMQAPPAKAA